MFQSFFFLFLLLLLLLKLTKFYCYHAIFKGTNLLKTFFVKKVIEEIKTNKDFV